jgi:hypothetical protein
LFLNLVIFVSSADALPYADADLQSMDEFAINDGNNRVTIEEIEQTTLEREINREIRPALKENTPNISNSEIRDEPKGNYDI